VRVGPKDAKDIVDEHVAKGNRIERLLYKDPQKEESVSTQEEMAFYKKQHRVALRNCGLINPEDIYESIAVGGYEHWEKFFAACPGMRLLIQLKNQDCAEGAAVDSLQDLSGRLQKSRKAK
jgi:hypothetical protein